MMTTRPKLKERRSFMVCMIALAAASFACGIATWVWLFKLFTKRYRLSVSQRSGRFNCRQPNQANVSRKQLRVTKYDYQGNAHHVNADSLEEAIELSLGKVKGLNKYYISTNIRRDASWTRERLS